MYSRHHIFLLYNVCHSRIEGLKSIPLKQWYNVSKIRQSITPNINYFRPRLKINVWIHNSNNFFSLHSRCFSYVVLDISLVSWKENFTFFYFSWTIKVEIWVSSVCEKYFMTPTKWNPKILHHSSCFFILLWTKCSMWNVILRMECWKLSFCGYLDISFY